MHRCIGKTGAGGFSPVHPRDPATLAPMELRLSRTVCVVLAALGCTRTPEAPVHPPPPATASATATASDSAAPAASSAEPEAPPFSATAAAAIDESVSGAMARGEIPGAVVTVVHGGRTVFEKAYGQRTKDPTVPLSPDAV